MSLDGRVTDVEGSVKGKAWILRIEMKKKMDRKPLMTMIGPLQR